jgi:hypothetical protein
MQSESDRKPTCRSLASKSFSFNDLRSDKSGRQDLNPTPILRQAIATLAVASIAKCAALHMRCVLGALIGFEWR